MPKKPSKRTSVIPVEQKVEHFSRIAPSGFKLPKESRSAVGFDREGKPAWFLFDSIAFWEFVCRIDEKLFETLSDKAYEAVSLGKLIDTLEERWPFSEGYKEELKREYERTLRDVKMGKVKMFSS